MPANKAKTASYLERKGPRRSQAISRRFYVAFVLFVQLWALLNVQIIELSFLKSIRLHYTAAIDTERL